MPASRALAIFAAVVIAAVAVPTVQAAPASAKKATKMYKWTDKQGVVHYGSDIPPEYADQKKEQINAQGQTIKEIDGKMTPEEHAAREKQQQDEEAAKARLANDKVLLSTYGSAADIERARDTRLAAIQSQINIASSTVSALEQEIVRLEKLRANAKDPKQLERVEGQLATQHRELNANQRAVVLKQDEKAAVATQFNADITRYRELTSPAAKPKP